MNRKACVIGSGFGGLALAIRLQSAGIETIIVEARGKPGGRAGFREQDGFKFDGSPMAITDPAALRELWELSGHEITADVELMPVLPCHRLNWPDGTNFDYSNDEPAFRREIARMAPEDLSGYDEFQRYAASVYQDGYIGMGHEAFPDAASMLKAAPTLLRHQAWRSVYSIVSSYVGNEKLREALSFQTLLAGGNPMTASAIHAFIHALEMKSGTWWPKGGINRLAASMVRLFERLGGEIRLNDAAVQIHVIGDRAAEVETGSGWKSRFDAVASNADIMHTYRDLLSENQRGPEMAKKLFTKRFSPSIFAVHFGIDGTWPGIPHNMILFGPRYRELMADIYDHGVLPQDFAIYLHHPSVTDASVAPDGKSTFCAQVPVAHLGKLPIDWDEFGPALETRVLDEIGRRLIPDIHDRIITKFHTTPKDLADEHNAWQGSAFSLEPTLLQSAFFRPHNRDDAIGNFYLVGAGTHPGAGIPGVVAGARITAGMMLDGLK